LDGVLIAAIPASEPEMMTNATPVTAALGAPDLRRLSVAVYAITVMATDLRTISLDLDDPELADNFHGGERKAGMHSSGPKVASRSPETSPPACKTRCCCAWISNPTPCAAGSRRTWHNF
jgi:hypothetical protein